MKQSNKHPRKLNHQESDIFLKCPERLWKHFSEVMDMERGMPFFLPTTSMAETIQDKIKALFKIEIEETVAKEFFLLQYAITQNDSYCGYSKHNFTKTDLIKKNTEEIRNFPEIKQAEKKQKEAVRIEKSRKDVRSNLLHTMHKITTDYNDLMEECIELIRLKEMEGFEEEIEEIAPKVKRVRSEEQKKEDEMFDLIRDKTPDGRPKVRKKLPTTGSTHLDDELLLPAILEFQIKITTNLPTVITRLKRYIDLEEPGKIGGRLKEHLDIKDAEKNVKSRERRSDLEKTAEELVDEEDLKDSFKEIYLVKGKDISENLWLIEAIRESCIEERAKQIDGRQSIPKVDKPFHSMVKALYEFIDEVLSKDHPATNRMIANWILAESGILMKEKLFQKINENKNSNNTSYRNYKEYLKAINPLRDR